MLPSNGPEYNLSSSPWTLPRTSSESSSTLDMHYAPTPGFDLEALELYDVNIPAANSLAPTWQWNVPGSSGPVAPQRGSLTSDVLSTTSVGSLLPQSNITAASMEPLDSSILLEADLSINTSDLSTDLQSEDVYNNSWSSFPSSRDQIATQESDNQSSNSSQASPASAVEGSPSVFNCHMGDATFTEEKTYRRHLREHQKPHTCERCPKAFRFKRDLKRHNQIHNIYYKDGSQIRLGDYTMCPFTECKYSLQGFSRRDNYLRHLRNQHKSSLSKV